MNRRQMGVYATALCTACVFSMAAFGQDGLHPIAKEVKASLKNPGKPFTMLVYLVVKKGAGEKLEAAFAPALKVTRKEKGNIAYQLNRDAKKPSLYVLYERWRNLEALDKHLKTEYLAKLLKQADDLLAEAPKVQVLFFVGNKD